MWLRSVTYGRAADTQRPVASESRSCWHRTRRASAVSRHSGAKCGRVPAEWQKEMLRRCRFKSLQSCLPPQQEASRLGLINLRLGLQEAGRGGANKEEVQQPTLVRASLRRRAPADKEHRVAQRGLNHRSSRVRRVFEAVKPKT